MIKENLARLREEIASVCRSAGRNPKEITLVGVTKFVLVETCKEAIEAGLTDVAENRLQEAEKKLQGFAQS